MRRILLTLVIATATVLSFNSCTKEYTSLPGTSYVLSIDQNSWTAHAEDDKIFYVDIDMPELNDVIYEDGDVSVALAVPDLDGPDFYELIPSTIGEYHFTANYGIGTVRIYAEYRADGAVVKPYNARVKIVLSEANIGY